MSRKILVTLIFFVILIITKSSSAQSSDAIAIRVIPNPDHHSATRWYKEQGFKGSPQSLLVDGYEAVRDGRTVYVDAANIESGALYTNIYLISYNQAAEPSTVDIFGQVLNHWKFNSNLNTPGLCSSTTLDCLLDTDCPFGEYCLSQKAKVIRDTRRLAYLGDIETMLLNYDAKYKEYPRLTAGSYVPQKTISVWPSWEKAFAEDLGAPLPVDPVNKLGPCLSPTGFHPVTCWNEDTKQFADPVPNNTVFDLPNNSLAMVYVVNPNGQSYELCAAMESGMVNSPGACSSAQTIGVKSNKPNNPPVITGANFPPAIIGMPYSGYVSAADPDNDILSWSSSGGWAGLNLEATTKPNQKRFHALSTPGLGSYNISVTVDDGRGGSATGNYTITVVNEPPAIGVTNVTYRASSTNPLGYMTIINSRPAAMPFSSCGITSALPASLSQSCTQAGSQYVFNLTGIFAPASARPIDPSKDYPFTLAATDGFGSQSQANFNIHVINSKPVISAPNCPAAVRVNAAYPGCTYSATDPDGNLIDSFSFTGLPAGLSGNTATGQIAGTPAAAGIYAIRAAAMDEYGALSAEAGFNLAVNTYCGDFVKQTPNTEKSGGPAGDGREDCDNADGVATAPGASSAGRQYECSANCEYAGGWCGDKNVQTNHGEQCEIQGTGNLGTGYSCSTDCQWTGGSCGDGMVQYANGEKCDDALAYTGTGPADHWSCGSCQWTSGFCGDGILDPGTPEQCDAGAGNTNTPCTAPYNGSCTNCNTSCQTVTTGGHYCGDPYIDLPMEQCQLGQVGLGTGINDQYQCFGCIWTGGWCGNGNTESVETCDQAGGNTNTPCTAPYNSTCSYCRTNCQQVTLVSPEHCGDGIINGPEQCDGSNFGSQTCVSLGLPGGILSCNGNCTNNIVCCEVNAALQVCADNNNTTYFNGNLLFSGSNMGNLPNISDWTIQTDNIILQPGKNVLAIYGEDFGMVRGIAAAITLPVCPIVQSTANPSAWRCVNAATPITGWEQVNYDDSAWPVAVNSGTAGPRVGNGIAYPMLWFPGANVAGSFVYCRYSFNW